MSWVITPSNALVDDQDALTYLTAVEAADGQALESATRLAVNAFVKGCKSDGIWPAIKASCILAGARTLTGALVPLAGAAPTNVNFVSGDYNRKTGLVGDGSTKYLNSNRNTNADPQNNHHYSVYSPAPTNVTAGIIGGRSTAVNTGTKQLNWIASTGAEFRACSATATIVASATPTIGVYGASRSLSTSFQTRVATSTSTQVVSSDGLDTGNFFVFARNTGGTAQIFSGWRIAFYSIGESLNLTQLDTRVTTLINAFAAAIP
jgi:hypothetical protein